MGPESGHTPALTRLICLEGADETSYQKAEQHLAETGGIHVCGRKIQRMVQRVGSAVQTWQSGVFWSKPGAEKMLALRCIHANRTLKAFWKDRLTLTSSPTNTSAWPRNRRNLSCARAQREHIMPIDIWDVGNTLCVLTEAEDWP